MSVATSNCSASGACVGEMIPAFRGVSHRGVSSSNHSRCPPRGVLRGVLRGVPCGEDSSAGSPIGVALGDSSIFRPHHAVYLGKGQCGRKAQPAQIAKAGEQSAVLGREDKRGQVSQKMGRGRYESVFFHPACSLLGLLQYNSHIDIAVHRSRAPGTRPPEPAHQRSGALSLPPLQFPNLSPFSPSRALSRDTARPTVHRAAITIRRSRAVHRSDHVASHYIIHRLTHTASHTVQDRAALRCMHYIKRKGLTSYTADPALGASPRPSQRNRSVDVLQRPECWRMEPICRARRNPLSASLTAPLSCAPALNDYFYVLA